MFKLHLSTLSSFAPDLRPPELDIALTSVGFGKGREYEFFQLFNGRRRIDSSAVFSTLTSEFPGAGKAVTMDMRMNIESEFAVWFRLATRSTPLGEGARAFIPRLAFGDEVIMTAIDGMTTLGNVIHRGARAHNDCRVQCADGTSSQGCVTCTTDGVTIKLCC